MDWLLITTALAVGALFSGLLLGRLTGLRWWVYLIDVTVLLSVAAAVLETLVADSPAFGWWALSVAVGVMTGVIAFLLTRAPMSTSAWIAVGTALALVAGVGWLGFHAGVVYARDTVSTPVDPGAGEINPHDCNVATISATHPDKPDTWAALGDSYSAGVGGELNGTAFGQDITNAFAWVGAAQLINHNNGDRFGLFMSACSGAVVRNLFHTLAKPTEQLTVDELPNKLDDRFWRGLPDDLQTLRKASVVTLTIGGNDAGFGNIAGTLGSDIGCARGKTCKILSDGGLANTAKDGPERAFTRGASPDQEWAELEERLQRAYELTVTLIQPEARLFVIQYPMAFAGSIQGCAVGRTIGTRNIRYINRFASTLDETIAKAAAAAAAATDRTITVIRWGGEKPWRTDSTQLGAGVPFSEHGLCSKVPWLNGFGPTSSGRTVDDSFHPTTLGSLAAGCATVRAIFEVQANLRPEGYRVVPSRRCPPPETR